MPFSSVYLTIACALWSAIRVYATFGDSAYWMTDIVKAPYIYFESTLLVPAVPAKAWQTLFVWPGLQPLSGGKNYFPIDNGVLQPVLTYGRSCAPNPNNLHINVDTTWWISAQYVNTFGNASNFSGCFGGDRMAVSAGDSIKIIMQLNTSTNVWTQSVLNVKTGKSVSFAKDMKGQAQGWAELVLEYYGQWLSPPPKFTFTNVILKASAASPQFCAYSTNTKRLPGSKLVCTKAVVNGATCTVAQCTFN